jgi:hypothetical protein
MRALRRRIIDRQGQVSCLRVAEVVCTTLHTTSYPIPVVSSFCKFAQRSLGDSDQNFADYILLWTKGWESNLFSPAQATWMLGSAPVSIPPPTLLASCEIRCQPNQIGCPKFE